MKHDVHDTAVADRARTEEKWGSGQSDAEKQEMMKKMEAAGTPGPAHKALDARGRRLVDHRVAPYQTMRKSTMSSIQITRETRTEIAI